MRRTPHSAMRPFMHSLALRHPLRVEPTQSANLVHYLQNSATRTPSVSNTGLNSKPYEHVMNRIEESESGLNV
jgi:hypothetical protein